MTINRSGVTPKIKDIYKSIIIILFWVNSPPLFSQTLTTGSENPVNLNQVPFENLTLSLPKNLFHGDTISCQLSQINPPKEAPVYNWNLIIENDTSLLIEKNALTTGSEYQFKFQSIFSDTIIHEPQKLHFTVNTPPSVPEFIFPDQKIFTSQNPELHFLLSKDQQIPIDSIIYEITLLQIKSDTLLLEQKQFFIKEPDDTLIYIPEISLAENGQFISIARSFDGIEYSSYSKALRFHVNAINEPPHPFTLKQPELIISETPPQLEWQIANDPDAGLDGGIARYLVQVSTSFTFRDILYTKEVDPKQQNCVPDSPENHLTYYYRVIAEDSTGLQTVSPQTGSFVINSSNAPPNPPKILRPVNNQIMKPTDYLGFRLAGDPDKHDKLSAEIFLLSMNGDTAATFQLTDSLISGARFNFYSGIRINYDNSIHFRLNRMPVLQNLTDTKFYKIAVDIHDNWGGKTASKWPNASFQFDDNINQNPLPPKSGLSPDSTVVTNIYPKFYWNEGSDSDVADKIRYQIILSRTRHFMGNYILEDTPYGEQEISLRHPLLENMRYYWKVRSVDLMDAKSEWSRPAEFWVNEINEPPYGPIRFLEPGRLTEIRPDANFWWFLTGDPDPFDKVDYLFQMAEDKDFSRLVIQYRVDSQSQAANWTADYPKPPGTIGICLSDIPESKQLIDNQLYYWQVLAVDHAGVKSAPMVSPPRIAFNSVNNPPDSIRQIFSPKEREIVKSRTPLISWRSVSDPDFTDFDNTLGYEIQLSSDPYFSEDNIAVYTQGSGLSKFLIPDKLAENQLYYFRIRAFDSHNAYSRWTQPVSFFVNAENEAPFTVARDFLPRDSLEVDILTPTISWMATDDPDPDQSAGDLTYIVNYVSDQYWQTRKQKKKTKQVESQTGVNTVTLPELDENQYYFYQVAARDIYGKQSGFSKWQCFSVNRVDEAPKPFSLLFPGQYQDSLLTDDCFIWQNSYDPDPNSPIRFVLYYGTDSLFISNTLSVPVEPTPGDSVIYCPPGGLEPASKYFWKVLAEDNTGNQTWGSGADATGYVFTTYGYWKGYDPSAKNYILYQNMPNPFNIETRIPYSLRQSAFVEITIYDLIGKQVKKLVSSQHLPGEYTVTWNGTDFNNYRVPGGIYICRMRAGRYTTNKKIVLMR